MDKQCDCVECGQPAELKYEIRIIKKSNKKVIIKGIPYYVCTSCGEPTYDFHVELKVEQMVDGLMEQSQNKKEEILANY